MKIYRRLWVILFFSCVCGTVTAQSPVVKELSRDLSFLLRKPVSSYKGALLCKDHGPNLNKVYSDTLRCYSYELVFYVGDSVRVDDIEFRDVFLHLDSLKNIEGISYSRSYFNANISRLNGDFNSLINYFNGLFGKKGVRRKQPRMKGSYTQIYEWKLPGKRISLSATRFEKRPNINFRGVLDLGIWTR